MSIDPRVHASDFLTLACVFALSGCDEAAPNAVLTVDSAGVRVVTHQSNLDAPIWVVDSLSTTIVGNREGEAGHDLSRLSGAIRLDDGGLVIADGGSSEIRYFNAKGDFVRAVGGNGSAPGEFRGLNWIRRRADTIVAYDSRHQRLSFFDLDGALLRTTPIRESKELRYPRIVALLDDEIALVQVGINPEAMSGVQAFDFMLYRYFFDGDSASAVGRFRGDETYFHIGEGMVETFPVPFGGAGSVSVSGNHFVVAHNDHFQFDVFTINGALTGSIRRSSEPSQVSSEDVARLRSDMGEAMGRRLEEVWREIPINETMPAFGHAPHLRDLPHFTTDDDGNLWVLEYTWKTGQPTEWTAYTSDGKVIGTLSLPPRHAPLHIGSDFIVLLARDALDVEIVKVQRLER